MTAPTQAQIEAAANAMIDKMVASHELPIDGELWCKYLETAKAALTAAAEVGPKINVYNSVYQEAIEQCARVVSDIDSADGSGMIYRKDAVAAIRALKEGP